MDRANISRAPDPVHPAARSARHSPTRVCIGHGGWCWGLRFRRPHRSQRREFGTRRVAPSADPLEKCCCVGRLPALAVKLPRGV
jgi:hypothetical protein